MEGTNETKHPLATDLSQKYADSILLELPEKQSGLHRPNVEKMCAMLAIEAETNGRQHQFLGLESYLSTAIPEVELMRAMVESRFPAKDCEPSPLYSMTCRAEINAAPVSIEAAYILEAAFRYLESVESLPKESAGRLESNG